MNQAKQPLSTTGRYDLFVKEIGQLLAEARRQTVRSLNAILTVTYWEIGRRIVEYEQGGKARAEYGEHLLSRLAKDLMAEHGRGFSARNLRLMRAFYSGWEIWQTPSAKFEARVKCPTLSDECLGKKRQTLPAKSTQPVAFLPAKSQAALADLFPLSWSHYVRLMMVEKPQDVVLPEEEIKDPYVLEFLGLKDEYSESELEEGLIRHLETFLLELGTDFAFVARQKRLRCLILIDLKIGRFTHADAGQMHLYLNYAREHWLHPDENPPVGLILCAQKDVAVAHPDRFESSQGHRSPWQEKRRGLSRRERQKMPKKQSDVNTWLGRETPRVRRALESASQHFDSSSRLTVHTLEAVYGRESSFGTMMREPGSSAAAGHFHFEPKTAKRYGLNVSKKNDERFDINKSSSAAARYLRDLDRAFSRKTTIWRQSKTVPVSSASERKKFVLGAFNAGERHIADAQRLAQEAGRNPRLWSDVQRFLEPASPKKERAKGKAKEIQQYVEKVLLYEIEFAQKSPAGKEKTAKKEKYRCTEGGRWVTIDDRPVYIC